MPLLFRAPSLSPARIHSPVELLDVYPTVLALAGIKANDNYWRNWPSIQKLHGRDLTADMRRAGGGGTAADTVAISQWKMWYEVHALPHSNS